MIHSPQTRRILSGLFIFAASLLVTTEGSAQSLGLAPAEIRAPFRPGEPLQFDLTVSNEGNAPVVMQASVTDLWYNDRNEKVFGAPGSQPRSAANWIEFVPRDFTVPAGGTGKVRVLITPPAGATGGYYAVLFVQSKPALAQARTAESQAIYTSMRLGALVLLNAVDTETYAIEVQPPTFTPPAPNQPLSLQFELTNRSNSHIFPQAKLAILGAGRQPVARAENEPRRFFPDQTDRMAVTWAGSLLPGDYVAILTLVYGNDKLYTSEFPFTIPQADAPPVRQLTDR
jgi:P pilus assembly chaperone PapD